ncbi:MAG: HAD family phosphatase [Pirellulales bacterium]|nr:HAD family phosphatase [Pirellulales bacterium]
MTNDKLHNTPVSPPQSTGPHPSSFIPYPSVPAPRFLYFDLGRVLVDFSLERMFRQLAAVAGLSPSRIGEVLFGGTLQKDYETGRLTSEQFYEEFCRQTDTRPAAADLAHAGTEIFQLNLSMLPVIAHLQQAGCRLGVLSNTCEGHWEYCFRTYRIVSEGFRIHVTSYQVGAVKPDPAIFRAAAERAGCRPEEIFFTDDIPGHVAAAGQFGFDAVLYTSTPELVAELRRRGIRFNY